MSKRPNPVGAGRKVVSQKHSRPAPLTVARPERARSLEMPTYLRCKWSSASDADFERAMAQLGKGWAAFAKTFSVGPDAPPAEEALAIRTRRDFAVFGIRECTRIVSRPELSEDVLCVIACLDGGQSPLAVAHLPALCMQAGVSLVLGRGSKQLGTVFGLRALTCVAVKRFAATTAEMLDFLLSLSSLASASVLAIESPSEALHKFKESLREPAREDKRASLPQKGGGSKTAPLPATKAPAAFKFYESFD